MVSFVAAGRLGNYFFECATAWAYAKRHSLEFSAPKFTSHDFWSPLYLHHLQNQNYNPHLPAIKVGEPHFHYSPIPFQEEWRNKNILLHGYFQSWKYFDEYRDEILDAFKIPFIPVPYLCTIHCRAGDYLILKQKHILMSEDYLRRAMDIVKEKTGITRFKVFSDDLHYFKETFGHIYNFEYSTNTDIISDITEMSWSRAFINSSSTYAWWGSYLSRHADKVVITPERWFITGWDQADTKDLIHPSWIKIPE